MAATLNPPVMDRFTTWARSWPELWRKLTELPTWLGVGNGAPPLWALDAGLLELVTWWRGLTPAPLDEAGVEAVCRQLRDVTAHVTAVAARAEAAVRAVAEAHRAKLTEL